MNKSAERCTEPAAIGDLAIELQLVVDQLEENWRQRHRIDRKAAEELHDLRVRAESLFSNAA